MIFRFGRVLCAAATAGAVTMAPLAAAADTRPSRGYLNQGNLTQSKPETSRSARQAKSHAGLNLLRDTGSGGTSAKRRRVAIGHGSYICSPAGFGQKSRCYSN